MALEEYSRKRDFNKTSEPRPGRVKIRQQKLSYLIQKHDATRLHYDFRLEFDGVLLSWAVTKGPSLNPADKRLAVRTEDHPLSYGSFTDLHDVNRQAREWPADVANQRLHRETRERPLDRFQPESLRPLPVIP